MMAKMKLIVEKIKFTQDKVILRIFMLQTEAIWFYLFNIIIFS